ncbi:hypothetical protein [Ehrlichia ruminantium]|uniref:hypothetical protein n=1 Tax=Ehrlichia ruminantium TaxID=779 RepID=UPI00214CA029|nr:hypothetical protein [Ehrlichia ruminantium]
MTTNQLMAFEYFAVALFILLTILIIIVIALEICNLMQQRKHITSSSDQGIEQEVTNSQALLDEVRSMKHDNMAIKSMCKELGNTTKSMLKEIDKIKKQQDIQPLNEPPYHVDISNLSMLSEKTDPLFDNIERAMC